MARLFTPSESKYYLMALDAGTGSIRAVIFDLEGNQIAVGQAEWRHLAVPDVPGSMEFDLNKNWQLACECMRQALHNAGIAPEYIAAVSACSMREGIVLYNNEGAPIWACANVDARAAREVSELKELHNNTFENEVYRATGQTLALSAIPRLLWLAHHRSDIYRQASTITMISDWLAYMLSGELAVDPSNAGTTGLLDLTTRDWKPALLDMAGLRADILSPVKETGTLLGVVSSQAAELCGLKAGTPVVVGGGDVQLGCLGLGVVRPAQTGFIGGNASGKGIVNISTDSLWNLKTSSTNAQLLQVGVLGTGELNITTGGIVKARDTQIALNDKSKGDVRVDGQNSLLETFNMYVGTSGTGTLTLTNSGTLNVEGGEVYLGVFEPAVGTLNIGAAHGEAAADAGYITNATKVEFGSGEGVFVFNHTNNSDAGYQVDMLITGDDKDGKVIHDAGHTVFNAGNTYSGKTLVNDGLLTIASHTADGVTGMGSSEVTIASPGTLDILASTNSAGDYTLTNALKGDGLMRVQLSSSDKMFGFTHATGTEFAGVAQLKDSTFTLERDNTAALTHAMLQSDSENTTSVKVGEQSIGGLAMNGGTLIFDTDIPAATLAEGYISVDTLVVGAGDYTWKGRNYQVNGTGDVLIDVPKPWNDPMANNPLTTLNLLEHDDSHVGVQLVKAQTVIGSGGSLTLRDLQGDEVEADKTLHIAQNGTVVAEGDYGFRLTTAPGDGLYVNYGLKALNIHGGQKLTLAEHGGAYGATADMSAKIGGEGDLAINTVRQVSLSNGQNDYQGATYVQMGTLRTDADGALGNTRELNISNAAIVDLNGSTQTVETFTGQMGSTVLFKEGALTVNKGGISQGELTGGGNLNVTGGTLAIEGLNARYNALTSISPNAEVSLDNTQGLGRGNIANDGLLTLKNVTGELRNSISGKGIVSATARTDVELDGDNSRFVGQFNIDTGSALSVNEQKNLGDASVINNGLLTISTERSWAMTHSISGSGDVTKLGTGILTLNNDSAAYQGTTDIVGGEIAFGSDSAINMASQHINIHNSGVMSGNVTTAGD
ncbi:FGGY family carbohydrate kinase, partial [Escherichia coli]